QQLRLGLAFWVLGVNQAGILRRDAPVAVIIPGNETIGDEAAHVLHPFFGAGIVLRDESEVAVLVAQFAGNNDRAAGPGDIVIVKGPVRRADIGDAAVRLLGIGHILEPFRVKGG